MALEYILTEKEFIEKKIGDKVVFGKKPDDLIGALENLTEFKSYEIQGKYWIDKYSYGFEIIDDVGELQRFHSVFFLSSSEEGMK